MRPNSKMFEDVYYLWKAWERRVCEMAEVLHAIRRPSQFLHEWEFYEMANGFITCVGDDGRGESFYLKFPVAYLNDDNYAETEKAAIKKAAEDLLAAEKAEKERNLEARRVMYDVLKKEFGEVAENNNNNKDTK